jgi:lactoylglutathione lyase
MRKTIAIVAMAASALFGVGSSSLAADAPKANATQPVITSERPRISYVAFRVADLDRSLKFYSGLLGMKERQRIPLDSGVLEVLLGYGDANKDAGILLLHDPKRTEPYTHGTGYHRYIIAVKDLPGLIAHLKANDVKITRGPTRVENLKLSYAFISDPDGYAIELVENE